MIKLKRIYDPPSPGDGRRILVDRLWPRGVKKEDAHINEWLKDIAPSNELRAWFHHEPEKWPEFRKRYRAELRSRMEVLDRLRSEAKRGTMTLLFSAKDEKRNNAVVLEECITEHSAARSGTMRRAA